MPCNNVHNYELSNRNNTVLYTVPPSDVIVLEPWPGLYVFLKTILQQICYGYYYPLISLKSLVTHLSAVFCRSVITLLLKDVLAFNTSSSSLSVKSSGIDAACVRRAATIIFYHSRKAFVSSVGTSYSKHSRCNCSRCLLSCYNWALLNPW
jgi:hypothetical protein